jgi:hypothetical protein
MSLTHELKFHKLAKHLCCYDDMQNGKNGGGLVALGLGDVPRLCTDAAHRMAAETSPNKQGVEQRCNTLLQPWRC